MTTTFKASFPYPDDPTALFKDDSEAISISFGDGICSVFAQSRDAIEGFLQRHGIQNGVCVECPEESWRDKWQETLEPISFGDGELIVAPSGYPVHSADIVLSPGRSFGIGHHPTTAMVVELMLLHRELIQGKDILDFGCGSGILSIVASRLDASSAFGCDNDTEAVTVSLENAELNEVSNAKFGLVLPNEGTYDALLLNVLLPTMRENRETISRRLRGECPIFCSGFLEEDVGEVATLWGREPRASLSRDGWAALILV